MALNTAQLSAQPGTPVAGGALKPAMDNLDLWQEAQDRVLLYLKKLGMPAILSLEIAREALRQAVNEAPAAGSEERPIALAVRALHMVFRHDSSLLEHTPYADYPILYRRWQPHGPSSPASSGAADPVTDLVSAAQPPIKRGTMVIRKI